MNRRNYLIRMGAGLGGVIAARHRVSDDPSNGAWSLRADQARNTLRPAFEHLEKSGGVHPFGKPDWNWTELPPKDNPGIRLIFVGMMVFTYKGNEGRVIFHRGAADHKLRIEIHEVSGKECREVFKLGGGIKPIDIDLMELRVKGKESNAAFFRSDAQQFNRKSGHPRDFRWLMDLESKDLYDRKLARTEQVFRTKLKVCNGTFYTYQVTNSQFRIDGGPKPGSVYHLAKVMAADIQVGNSECAFFTIDGTEVPYPLCGDSRYEIYFFNDCQCTDDNCENCKHSDFSMVFDALTMTAADQFTLALEKPGKETQTDGLCLKIPEKIIKVRNTDEAPCMGSGFGWGDGFP